MTTKGDEITVEIERRYMYDIPTSKSDVNSSFKDKNWFVVTTARVGLIMRRNSSSYWKRRKRQDFQCLRRWKSSTRMTQSKLQEAHNQPITFHTSWFLNKTGLKDYNAPGILLQLAPSNAEMYAVDGKRTSWGQSDHLQRIRPRRHLTCYSLLIARLNERQTKTDERASDE